MKVSSPLIIVAAMATSFSTHAASNSWYVGANLSSVDLADVETQSTEAVAGVFRNLDIDTDSDVGFGLKVGKTVFSSASGSLAVELNYSQSEHDAETIVFQGNTFTDGRAEGELEAKSLILSALYKFNTGAPVKPYVGVGVGLVDLSVDARYGGSIGSESVTRPPFASGSDNAFALEFTVGADWELNKQWSVFAEYSYTDVSDVNFSRLGGGPGGLATTNQEGDFDLQAFTVGVNYRF